MSDWNLSRRPATGTVLGLAALAIAMVALILSVTGFAGAAPQRIIVKKGDIAPGAVTAKNLAKGAVHPNALAKEAVKPGKIATGAVTIRTIKAGAVTAPAIGADAVTAPAVAPGSIHGYQLGAESIQSVTMSDLDTTAENPEWTASNSGVAKCPIGAALLGIGFDFPEPGNRQVTWLNASPFINLETGSGVNARFASNSGGSAQGRISVVCLS